MTRTVDVDERSSQFDSSHAIDGPASATQTRAKVRTFVFTFGIAFTLLYTVLERLNWPLFTYQPAAGKLYFWLHRPLSGEGPAHVLVWLDRKCRHRRVRGGLDRYDYFRSVAPPGDRFLLRPGRALAGRPCCTEIYITGWATFDADFLDSVWVAAPPAFVGAAAITYFVPPRLAERAWTSWLLIVPIAGLVVLGNSLLIYFVR